MSLRLFWYGDGPSNKRVNLSARRVTAPAEQTQAPRRSARRLRAALYVLCTRPPLMKRWSTCLLTPSLIAVSCIGGWGFVYDKPLSGIYTLQAIDSMDQLSVRETETKDGTHVDGISVIRATVFAVGWNDRFIICQATSSPDFRCPPRQIAHQLLHHNRGDACSRWAIL